MKRQVTAALLAAGIALAICPPVAASAGTARTAAAALPPGKTAAQWKKIAEDTGVGSSAVHAARLIHME